VRDRIRPWRVIATDDPNQGLGEGRQTRYPTLLEAAKAFVNHPLPYRTIFYDDGEQARELNDAEQLLVHNVAAKLGYEVDQLH
jgi:hypothetical protein